MRDRIIELRLIAQWEKWISAAPVNAKPGLFSGEDGDASSCCSGSRCC
nr:hypothetical protein [Saprospiraceae bacterium]